MKLIKFLFFIIVTLVIGNITLTNRSVDESLVVAGLSKDIATLQNENTIQRADVAASGSLGNLATKLEEAGFVESSSIAALPTTTSVALR